MIRKKHIVLYVLILLIPSIIYCQTWKELLQQADTYLSIDKRDSALILGQQALRVAQKTLHPDDTLYASVLNQVGVYYKYNKLLPQAESFWKQTLDIRERVLGRYHVEVARILHRLGLVSCEQFRLEEGEKYYLQAVDVYEKVLGEKDPERQKCLNNLGDHFHHAGRFEEAEMYLLKGLHVQENAFGSEHTAITGNLLNLGNFYVEAGKYLEAEQVLQRGLRILEKGVGPESVMVGGFINNLAIAYLHEGRLKEAEENIRRSFRYKKRLQGLTRNEYLINSIITLAQIETKEEKYDSAEIHFQTVISFYDSTFGRNHFLTSVALLDLAKVKLEHEKYPEAKILIIEALNIVKNGYGETHAKLAECYQVLAETYARQGMYHEADSLYTQAITVGKNTLGNYHPTLAVIYEDYGRFLRARGDLDVSIQHIAQAYEIRKQNFIQVSYGLSEKDAFLYSSMMCQTANLYLSLFSDSHSSNPELLQKTAEVILSSKGKITDGMMERKRFLGIQHDTILSKLTHIYRQAQFTLARLYGQGAEDGNTKNYKKRIDSLTTYIQQVESDLALRSTQFRENTVTQRSWITQIQLSLPSASTLVDFLRYDYIRSQDEQSVPHYLALLVGESKKLSIIELGEAKPLDELIVRYRKHFLGFAMSTIPLSQKDSVEYAGLSSALYKHVWKPVSSNIKSGATIYIAPDGGFNLISFAGLPDENGKFIIENHPLHFLSAGRDLIQQVHVAQSKTGLLAYGDPDYDATVSQRLEKKNNTHIATSLSKGNTYALRNVRSVCSSLQTMKATPLPATRSELEAIAQSWSASFPSEPSQYFTDAQASEEQLKKYCSNNRVVHLATHGYFINNECSMTEKNMLGKEILYAGENPLLQSGLLLAGANLHGKGADSTGAEDGILTALEVSAMNLQGTDLVVLSACETGLGKIEQSEGVYGLRRAFRIAGAKTVVSSLWKVPDIETMKFMKDLYSLKASTYPELMQKVALRRINELKLRGRPTHPYSWAGFIATGNWSIYDTVGMTR